MVRTSSPAVASARTADSRPAPGPLTFTSTLRRPDSLALLAAVSEACCAANGVPLRDPRKPSEPELDQESTFPNGSVMVMMVLLKEACTWTRPTGTFRFSFFLNAFFLPPFGFAAAFAGAFAIYDSLFKSSPMLSSCWPRCRDAVPCGCGRWCGSVVPGRAGRDDGADPGRRPSRSGA